MHRWPGSNAAGVAAALALGAAWVALPRPAAAVIVEGGSIETDGFDSTVDRYYFTVGAAGSLGVAAAQLVYDPPPVARLSFKIYRDDGALDPSDLLFSADAPAVGVAAVLDGTFAAGGYVAVLSEYPLAVGAFGPVHAAPVFAGYDYEFSLYGSVSNDSTVTGACQGNLNGTFTPRPSGTACPSGTPVPEPSSLFLLAVGTGLLSAARRARR